MFDNYMTYRKAMKMMKSVRAMKLGHGWEIVYQENILDFERKKILIRYTSCIDINPEDFTKIIKKIMDVCVKFHTSFYA